MILKGFFNLTATKFKTAKYDIPAIVNNTVLLLLAWIASFWIFQAITMLGAFSLGVEVVYYNSYIDFNVANVASSQKDLWSNAENINAIFFTPFISLIIVLLLAVFFLVKWDTDRLNMRRFEFWLILCATLRLSGNYIFGHLFGLWNWNLVTDFMYLTNTPFGRYTSIVVMVFFTVFVFNVMSRQIRKLFNPYKDNLFGNLMSNVFFPAFFACLFLIIWNMPYLPLNELCCIIYFLLLVSFCLCRKFVLMYSFLDYKDQGEYDEQINKQPIYILIAAFFVDIVGIRGWHLSSSPYRLLFVENIVMTIGFILVLIFIVIVYIIRKKREKKEWVEYIRQQQYIKPVIEKRTNYISIENKDVNLIEKEQSSTINHSQDKDFKADNELDKPDIEYSDQYGFKHYNLDDYNMSYW